MDKAQRVELARFYRRHLLEDVMPFWEARTRDDECGGYTTCFDRTGAVTDRTKYIWFQGRQLYMFSALCNQVEPRPVWLDLARHGRDYLVGAPYAGNGRWNYQLDPHGTVQKGTVSIYSDLFVLSGLCEYAVAAGTDADRALIEEAYAALDRNVRDPEFKDVFHGTWSPQFKRQAIYMITVHVAQPVRRVLGAARTQPLIDHCLEEILWVFAKDEQRLLFESVGRDGRVIDTDEGRLINPGHTLECMCFCIEEGRHRGDEKIVNRALDIIDWAWERGWDRECGGLFAFLDADGREPLQTDWHRETGMRWDDKCWWVHSEALYACALAAVLRDSPEHWSRFLDLHQWCQDHFYDPDYGEWYPELVRDGTPKLTDKGTLWKAAYHLPRALMNIALLLESTNT